MFTALQAEAAAGPGCAALEALVRAHFALAPDDAVVLLERGTLLPGCPPRETLIDFWTDLPDGGTQRHHCKVFKPAAEVLADDLPPPWLKPGLAVPPNYVCNCC